tara:strand:- start:1921 stop:2508 length:588 start_codon:yes stop_codon:yes gene_type:complete
MSLNTKTLARERLQYDLGFESVVFDVGGYHGHFADDISWLYGCTVHVFEPVNKFYNLIRNRFQYIPSIQVHPFGLSNKTEKVTFGMDGISTSLYKLGSYKTTVQLKNIEEVVDDLSLTNIDLIKLNIEGGEYSLLEHCLEKQLVSKMKNIQVQFHKDWGPGDAVNRRENIRKQLQDTHELTYNYDWVWENWRLKS